MATKTQFRRSNNAPENTTNNGEPDNGDQDTIPSEREESRLLHGACARFSLGVDQI